jgi:hypothetical protein
VADLLGAADREAAVGGDLARRMPIVRCASVPDGQTSGAAQTDAYSRAFFVIGLICLTGAVLALLLRSGKPTLSAPVAAY